MNYHELKRQYSPGPWRAAGDCSTFDGGRHPCVYDNTGKKLAMVFAHARSGDAPTDLHSEIEKAKASAAILVHCVNNFDKALERLKSIVKPINMASGDLRKANKTGTPSYLELLAMDIETIIAELEDVK